MARAEKKTAGSAKKAKPRAERGRSEPEPRSKGYAERVMEHLRDPSKTAALLEKVRKKLDDLESAHGPLASMWSYLEACYRLFRAYAAGDYTELPVRSMVLVTIAIIYFASPIDIIPDFLPLIGLVDDAAIIGFVISQVKRDLDAFLIWESQREARKK
ncbi:MAG: DUF1232 domain-containing protein [Planctomycetes bacterium]|nr:DUF1232 domain-containing protein [Planctomycetota bacterium]